MAAAPWAAQPSWTALMEINRAMDRNDLGTQLKAACLVRLPRATGALTRTLAAMFILLTYQPLCVKAQFEMIVFEKRPPQARSREELDAVLDIVQATDQRTIVSLCAEFRKKFPASELAGQVYRMEMHAYGRLDDNKLMIEAGEKALGVSGHDVDALLSLANAIPNGVRDLATESVGVLDKAEGYARKALEEIDRLKATRGVSLDRWRSLTGQMRSSAHEALGFIAFKRGRYAESVAEFEKSIGLSPGAGGAVFFRLGVAYLYDGKPFEAQVALERSSQLGPEFIRRKAKEQLAMIGKKNAPPK
jgi:tetratricopeptide (TPR) repeat protein